MNDQGTLFQPKQTGLFFGMFEKRRANTASLERGKTAMFAR